MLNDLRNIKGYLHRESLYNEMGKKFEINNYYTFSDEREHGYFQIEPSLREGYWCIIRKIVEMVEKLPT